MFEIFSSKNVSFIEEFTLRLSTNKIDEFNSEKIDNLIAHILTFGKKLKKLNLVINY